MKKMQKMVAGLLLAVLAVVGTGMVEKAEAVATSSDTITLLVTPGVNLSVTITSPTAGTGYDFTTVSLNSSSQSGLAATVTNNGDVAAQWTLRSAAAAGTTWIPGTSVAADQAVIQGLFGVNSSSYPTAAMFDKQDSTITTTMRTSKNDNIFSTGGVMGASVASSATKALWFRIKTPNTSSVATQQSFQVFVAAANP